MVADYQEFIASKSLRAQATGTPDVPPLGDYLFPFQQALVTWALRRGKAAIFAAVGLGKALASDTPVLTISGWRPISSLAPGDMVFSPDGKTYPVTGVFPQGTRDLFEVTFNDGVSVVCDAEHLWDVRTNDNRRRVLTLSQIIAEGTKNARGARRHFIPATKPVEFSDAILPVNPYTLGVLLGDGGLTRGTPVVTTDEEIVDRLELPAGVSANRGPVAGPGVYTFSIVGAGRGIDNPMTRAMRQLGLMGLYSHEKFVPQAYMMGSVDQRMALLQGILDTDGHVRPDGNIEFSTSSERLARDVGEIVMSFGGIARIRLKRSPKYTHNGEKRIGRDSFRMSVQLPGSVCPFRLTRKASVWRPRTKYMPVRAIESIVPVSPGDATCISVSSPDSLFIVNDYIVTHNTRMELEFASQASAYLDSIGQVSEALILTPLAVAAQTVREAGLIGIDAHYVKGYEQMVPGRITVTNYDRVKNFSPERFGVVVLDEASIIKHDDSATAQYLIDYCKRIPFRLPCSATPAPNAFKELGMYAELLGVMTKQEMLSEFFVHDSGGGSDKWRLKGHAAEAFWQWVASWGAMVQLPSDLGFDDTGYILPPLNIVDHVIRATNEQDAEILKLTRKPGVPQQMNLMPQPARGLRAQSKARRVTLQERVDVAAQIVAAHPNEQWSIWCELNDESDALQHAIKASIPGCVEICGGDSAASKEASLMGFASGKVPALVTKASIAGYGMNFQSCHNTILVGPTHSFEDFHQIVGRFLRFGQMSQVNVHIVYSELEGNVRANLMRKQDDFRRMGDAMRKHVGTFVLENVLGSARHTTPYNPTMAMTHSDWLSDNAERS